MIRSFAYALKGIFRTAAVERNMRVHLCFAFYVILGGIVTRLCPWEWAAVLGCIGLVTGAELMNTALEHLADRVTREKDPEIAAAKDAAAGGVLCTAVFAAAIGILVFFGGGHHLIAWAFAKSHPAAAAFFLLLLLPAAYFISHPEKPVETAEKTKDKDLNHD